MENTTKQHQIKLNSSNHITLHKIEEKMYTREYVENATYLAMMYGIRSYPIKLDQCQEVHKKWFEQNVK